MSEETLPKYKDPIWQDKANNHIVCRMLQGNGEYVVAHIVAADGVNPDFDAVLEMYGEEEIDRLTEEHKAERAEQEKIDKERALADQARHKQEILFNMKLEAFEIEEIKQSQNRELKKRLRKSKTPIEVHAYATLLIQEALADDTE
jgi:Skp family chaperone for outer membrane proteins